MWVDKKLVCLLIVVIRIENNDHKVVFKQFVAISNVPSNLGWSCVLTIEPEIKKVVVVKDFYRCALRGWNVLSGLHFIRDLHLVCQGPARVVQLSREFHVIVDANGPK